MARVVRLSSVFKGEFKMALRNQRGSLLMESILMIFLIIMVLFLFEIRSKEFLVNKKINRWETPK